MPCINMPAMKSLLMHSTLVTAIHNLHKLPTNQILIKNVTRSLFFVARFYVNDPNTCYSFGRDHTNCVSLP